MDKPGGFIMKNERIMEHEKISKLMWKFALPSIIAMVINALYGVVDRIFVGRGVGTLAIAGVMISFPIMLILFAIGVLVGYGGSSAISIYLGQKKEESAEKTLGNAFLVFIILSAVTVSIGNIFLKPVLILFGASPEVLPYAEKFARIILLGSIFQSIGFGINNIIRAEGNPTYSMITQITGAVLNALFCYIFIFQFNMGIEGSARATVLAQAIVSFMVVWHFYTKRSALRLRLRNLLPDFSIIRRILTIGMAQFSIQVSISIVVAILNTQLLKYGGNTAVSAWGAINSIMLLILMPVFGLNLGSQPIVGYNYGANNCGRVRQTLLLTIFNSTIIALTGAIMIQLFAPFIISSFVRNDSALIGIGSKGIRIFLAFLPILGFQISGASYFQYIGKPGQSMLLGLSRSVLLLIPAVLILPHFFGLFGIWLAGPTADGISSFLTGTFIFRELNHLKIPAYCVQPVRG